LPRYYGMQQLKQVGWGCKPHTGNSMKDKTQLPYVSSIFSSVSNLLTNLHLWFKPVLCQFFLNFEKPRTRGRFFRFWKYEELEPESQNWQRTRGLSWNQGFSISTIFKNLELEAINKIWELHNNGLNFLHYIVPQISLALS